MVLTLVPIDRSSSFTDTAKNPSRILHTEPPIGIPVFNLDAIDITLRALASCRFDASSERPKLIHDTTQGTNCIVLFHVKIAKSDREPFTRGG